MLHRIKARSAAPENGPNILFEPLISENSIITPPLAFDVSSSLHIYCTYRRKMGESNLYTIRRNIAKIAQVYFEIDLMLCVFLLLQRYPAKHEKQ